MLQDNGLARCEFFRNLNFFNSLPGTHILFLPYFLYEITGLMIGDEQIEEGDLMSADYCVCCGAIIPEGRQTCLECEKAASEGKSLYDDVCKELTDYEHASDPETPKQNLQRYSTIYS